MFKSHSLENITLLAIVASLAACGEPNTNDLSQTEDVLHAGEVFTPLLPEEDLHVVQNGDGTTSYLPSAEALVEVGALVQAGAITWRYDGQARFLDDGSQAPEPAQQRYRAHAEENTTLDEQLYSMVRVDNRGRRWVVESFDEEAIADAVRAYDADGEEQPDQIEEQPSMLLRANNPDETPPLGTWVEVEPHSWSHFTCPAEGISPEVETHTWEGEDRFTVSTHTFQEQAAVKVLAFRAWVDQNGDPDPGQSHCSGTMIDDRHVLTAAHCVSNVNNFDLQTNRVRVCLDTNNECTGNYLGDSNGLAIPGAFFLPSSARTVVAIDRPTTYTGASGDAGGTDFADDWAIITLSGSFSTRSLRLSGMSDSRMLALTRTRSFGYPAQRRDGSGSGCRETLTDLQAVTEIEPPASTTTKKVRHRMDGTAGQSGSPFYYCPHESDSFCNQHPTETGFVYAVHAGWNSFNQRVVGPKVPNFRATAIALAGL